MLASRKLGAVMYGLALCGNLAVAADDEEMPNADFLEYLGMWEETDEVWLLLDEAMAAENEERSDPAPEGEESMEKDDES